MITETMRLLRAVDRDANLALSQSAKGHWFATAFRGQDVAHGAFMTGCGDTADAALTRLVKGLEGALGRRLHGKLGFGVREAS